MAFLINSIFKVLQKLLKYFSETTNSVLFLSALFGSQPLSLSPRLWVLPVTLVLYLKDSESEERGLLGYCL